MASGPDVLARVLSNRRLADHLRWIADTVIDDRLAQAWLKEASRRVRSCSCPRLVPSITAADAAVASCAVNGSAGTGGAHTSPGHPNGETSP